MPSMNSCSHPRPSNVSRHACRLFVSYQPKFTLCYLVGPQITHYDLLSLLHPIFKAEENAHLRILLRLLHPSRPIQST
jgi:hypothetical protein